MRRITILTLGLSLVLGGLAAAQSQEELEKRYQEKLNKDFVQKISWVRSLEEAKEQAKAEDKLILGYFTRSYAH